MQKSNNYSYVNNNNLYICGKDPKRFSGLIYASDFNTNSRKETNNGSCVARRIISDWAFDRRCEIKNEMRKVNDSKTKI